jgi:hypothetical protein
MRFTLSVLVVGNRREFCDALILRCDYLIQYENHGDNLNSSWLLLDKSQFVSVAKGWHQVK